MTKLSFCSFRQFLNEEIDPKTATTPSGAIASVINGEREVGYDKLGKKELKKLDAAGVEYVKVPRKDSLKYYIFFRDHEKAKQLFDISQKHGGLLSPSSAEEARKIGTLLGYDEDSIEYYVRMKFSKKIPVAPNININDLNDYD